MPDGDVAVDLLVTIAVREFRLVRFDLRPELFAAARPRRVSRPTWTSSFRAFGCHLARSNSHPTELP
jgi:hypothetical protein